MKPLRHQLAPFAAAIAAATQCPVASSATYVVSFAGFADNMDRFINLPGVPTSVSTPLYQLPRIAGFGVGWETTADIAIDASSGAVTDFEYTIRAAGWFGWGSPEWELRADERIYRPMPQYRSQFAGGAAFCSVVDGANDNNGVLVFDCPPMSNNHRFAKLDATGHLCGTPGPSSLAPGNNGCMHHWGGFPAGYSAPQVATRSGIAVPANLTVDGIAVSLTAMNPAVYRSLDHAQNQAAIAMHEAEGAKSGGRFEIAHSGTLQGGDFQAISLRLVDWRFNELPNPDVPGATYLDETRTEYVFATVNAQQFVLESGEAKAVPAMGLTWFAALFASITALARGLLRSGRRHEHSA